MISIIADTHTHTLACDHAYSTIEENAAAAAQKGLRFLAMTEHGPAMPGGPSYIHFSNLGKIPRRLHDVVILKGAEVNIMNYKGALDLEDWLLGSLNWVIASMHVVTVEPASVKDHTAGWVAVANNPLVDVIGHCGDARYPFEHKAAIREFARCGKIVEINAHSFRGRPGSPENCRAVAELCAEYGVPVVVSSDAHHYTQVGEFRASLEMLESIHFPRELILNADYGRFLAVAEEKSGKKLA